MDSGSGGSDYLGIGLIIAGLVFLVVGFIIAAISGILFGASMAPYSIEASQTTTLIVAFFVIAGIACLVIGIVMEFSGSSGNGGEM